MADAKRDRIIKVELHIFDDADAAVCSNNTRIIAFACHVRMEIAKGSANWRCKYVTSETI